MLAFSHDIAAAIFAWILSYWLRFNLDLPQLYAESMLATMVWIIPGQGLVFVYFGLYRGIWRHASLPDLKQIFQAVSLSAVVAPVLYFFLKPDVVLPRAVLILDPILLLLMMGGSRLVYRLWNEYRIYGSMSLQGTPVLILGAGTAAVNLLKDLSKNTEWQVVGLLDDNIGKRGRMLHGVKVLGCLEELSQWAEKLEVQQAIIAMPSADHHLRRRAVGICTNAGISVMTVPSFEDLMSGRVAVSQIRKVEVDDLLGRDPVLLDSAGMHGFITGRVIMVTGAGGSIGSELCRQIARFQPSLLVFFELSEFALYKLEQEFCENFSDITIACVIGDIKNKMRVQQVIRTYAPSVIFHAAAYKHVPLMENENAWEAMQNNVLGTHTLAMAAIDNNVQKFVLISTDKAVNPTNVMGASKRLAEMVCQGLQKKEQTKFTIVRFGNVLGSAGSVIPKFHCQIERGGPITVTHPEITRYFMAIPEAAQLVCQAGMMGKGGEIFVLDMGEPIKIVDLARDMIKLSGFNEEDIKIIFTGLRPGEKLYEELLAHDEHTLQTPHSKLRVYKARDVNEELVIDLHSWLTLHYLISDEDVKDALIRWVPEYKKDESTLAMRQFAAK